MSEQHKAPAPARPEFFGLPIVGVDLGEKLGSLDARLIQAGLDVTEIKHDLKLVEPVLTAKIEAVDARLTSVEAKLFEKIEALDRRVDKCLVIINRLDERTKNMEARQDERMASLEARLMDNSRATWVIGAALLVAIIATKFI
jgi:hypothetical protein